MSDTLIAIGLALLASCLIWTLGQTYLAWRHERDELRRQMSVDSEDILS